MTTPRDAIAGLSERLMAERKARVLDPMRPANPLLLEAATQLDSLLKEREALYQRLDAAAQMDREKTVRIVDAESRADALQARVENALHDRNNALRLQEMLEGEVKTLQARVKEYQLAEQELRSLLCSFVEQHCDPVPQWRPLDDMRGLISQFDNASTVVREFKVRAARLQQERDEARTALDAILSANDDFRAGLPQDWEGDPLQDACDTARDLVRRLAGPEKEGK